MQKLQLQKRQMVLISFMLFSLFFGAGNLIFPPFLGQNAGANTVVAFLGFIVTAVVLPVLGVIVVSKFSGLESLGRLVGARFAIIFTVIIYLSIGPGLGIPRAASVPFEMAIAPYMPADSNKELFMALYSFIFFAIALWLCLTPGKLVKRIGTFLTPSLLILILVLFITFLCKGDVNVANPSGPYDGGAFLQGFRDGYDTMDAIAALNFGLVIALTLNNFGVEDKKGVMKHTVLAGCVAGSILTFVYFMLAFMGAKSSGIYPDSQNGAELLRNIVMQLFGEPGAILLAAIFTLACLTTCVGLINSISAYFSTLFKKVSYRKWVIIITLFSFLICNLGLNMILSISVPVLDVVYPISIMLIVFGLTANLFRRFHLVFPITIAGVTVTSLFSAIFKTVMKTHDLGGFGTFLKGIPLFEAGYFWVIVAAVMLAGTMIGYGIYYAKNKDKYLAYENVPTEAEIATLEQDVARVQEEAELSKLVKKYGDVDATKLENDLMHDEVLVNDESVDVAEEPSIPAPSTDTTAEEEAVIEDLVDKYGDVDPDKLERDLDGANDVVDAESTDTETK